MSYLRKKIFTGDLAGMIGKPIQEMFLLMQMKESDNTENAWQSFVFGDIHGRVNGKAWSQNMKPEYEQYVGTVCMVTGYVEKFRGLPTIKVSTIRPLNEKVEFADYVRCFSKEERQAHANIVKGLINSIKDPNLRTLVVDSLVGVWSDFTVYPADVKLHHNIAGGLLVHTTEVAKTTDLLIGQYGAHSAIDRDLCIAGALLHDVGACTALNTKGFIYEKGPQYDMLGIAAESNMQVIKCWYQKHEDAPKTFDLTKLRNIISAAQKDGERPLTKEACIVKRANEISEEISAYDELFYSYDNASVKDSEVMKEGIKSEYFGGLMYRDISKKEGAAC